MIIAAVVVALWVGANALLLFVLWFFTAGGAKLRGLNRVGERRAKSREGPKL